MPPQKTPPVPKSGLIELDIIDLAYGGKGVAKVDNFVVFVSNAVPGDRVKANITKRHKNHAEAETVEVLTASPDRVEAPCPLFGECGGCTWQNLSYEKQLEHKQKQAEASLQHLGKAKPDTILPIIPSPNAWRYRNKMDFTFGRSDTGETILGFHKPGMFWKIIETPKCFLQPEPLDRLLSALMAWVKRKKLTAYREKSHEGFLRHLLLRHSVATGDVVAVLLTNTGDLPDKEELIEELRAACPELKGFVWGLNTGMADFAKQESEVWHWGEPWTFEELEGIRFRVSPLSFFQVNTAAAEKLYGVVRDLLGDEAKNMRLLDAYCGTGSIGIFCASKVREIVGVEIIRDAIWDARENAARNNIPNCTFIAGDMREALELACATSNESFGRIVMDPPRGGMDKRALAGLLAIDAPVLIYVSCNPATLARDLVTITEAGYRPTVMQPVDLFPQTYHIETVVRFEKEAVATTGNSAAGTL